MFHRLRDAAVVPVTGGEWRQLFKQNRWKAKVIGFVDAWIDSDVLEVLFVHKHPVIAKAYYPHDQFLDLKPLPL